MNLFFFIHIKVSYVTVCGNKIQRIFFAFEWHFAIEAPCFGWRSFVLMHASANRLTICLMRLIYEIVCIRLSVAAKQAIFDWFFLELTTSEMMCAMLIISQAIKTEKFINRNQLQCTKLKLNEYVDCRA